MHDPSGTLATHHHVGDRQGVYYTLGVCVWGAKNAADRQREAVDGYVLPACMADVWHF